MSIRLYYGCELGGNPSTPSHSNHERSTHEELLSGVQVGWSHNLSFIKRSLVSQKNPIWSPICSGCFNFNFCMKQEFEFNSLNGIFSSMVYVNYFLNNCLRWLGKNAIASSPIWWKIIHKHPWNIMFEAAGCCHLWKIIHKVSDGSTARSFGFSVQYTWFEDFTHSKYIGIPWEHFSFDPDLLLFIIFID